MFFVLASAALAGPVDDCTREDNVFTCGEARLVVLNEAFPDGGTLGFGDAGSTYIEPVLEDVFARALPGFAGTYWTAGMWEVPSGRVRLFAVRAARTPFAPGTWRGWAVMPTVNQAGAPALCVAPRAEHAARDACRDRVAEFATLPVVQYRVE